MTEIISTLSNFCRADPRKAFDDFMIFLRVNSSENSINEQKNHKSANALFGDAGIKLDKVEIIEPSEIITGEDRVHAKSKKANPWVRGLARFVDYSLFCLVLCLFKKFFHYEKGAVGFLENLIPLEFLCWIPFETLFLVLWGKTPGKWFLRTDLQFGRKKRADLMTALKRSFSVWWRGLGLGIPFLNGLCMLTAYYRLTTMQTTSWDREGHIYVSHRPIPRWRLIVATLLGFGGLFLYRSC